MLDEEKMLTFQVSGVSSRDRIHWLIQRDDKHTHTHTLIISPEAWRGTLAQFILSSLITLQMSSNINWSTKLSTSSQTPLFPLPLSSPAVHVPDLHPRSHLHRHLRLHSGTRFPLLQHVDHLCSHEIPWRQHHLSWLHLCGRQAVRLVITVHSRNDDVILTQKTIRSLVFLSLLMRRFFQIDRATPFSRVI